MLCALYFMRLLLSKKTSSSFSFKAFSFASVKSYAVDTRTNDSMGYKHADSGGFQCHFLVGSFKVNLREKKRE